MMSDSLGTNTRSPIRYPILDVRYEFLANTVSEYTKVASYTNLV